MSAKKSSFGHIKGGKVSVPVEMAADEVLKVQSGRFIHLSSGYGVVSDDGTNKIFGFAESGDLTCGDANGDDVVNCIVDPSAVFRVPFIYDATYTQNYAITLLGTAVDLEVISDVQFVNLLTSDDDLLIVVGGKAASAVATNAINDGYVDVMMNPGEMMGRS